MRLSVLSRGTGSMRRRIAGGWLATGWFLAVAGVASAQAVVTSPTPVIQSASPAAPLTAVENVGGNPGPIVEFGYVIQPFVPE